MTDEDDEAAYAEYRSRPTSGHADGFEPGTPALKHAFFAGIAHGRAVNKISPVELSEKPNMRRLANGCYLVRTQAGFRRAIKEYFDEYELRQVHEIDGHPTAYPSVVRFNFVHGWNKPQAYCTPINKYVQHIRDLLADLETE